MHLEGAGWKIVNELANEYAAWYGWTSGFGRYVALGEYILEETEGEIQFTISG